MLALVIALMKMRRTLLTFSLMTILKEENR